MNGERVRDGWKEDTWINFPPNNTKRFQPAVISVINSSQFVINSFFALNTSFGTIQNFLSETNPGDKSGHRLGE